MHPTSQITTEFTGYYDSVEQEYVYPSARQNALLFVDVPLDILTSIPPYLSGRDGDFTADGLTWTSSIGESEDITIGNAPSASLSGTFLNESGLLEYATFSEYCQLWIGVATASNFAIPDGVSCFLPGHDENGSPCVYYGIDDEIYQNGTAMGFTGHGNFVSIVEVPDADGTVMPPIFFTDEGYHYAYVDPGSVVPPAPSGWVGGSGGIAIGSVQWSQFMATKFVEHPQSISFGAYNRYYDVLTVTEYDVNNDQILSWKYVPVGIFDFSSISVYGTAYTFEVYDRMTSMDRDATAWINSLDFTSPKTTTAFIQELMAELGFYGTIPPSYTYTYYTIDANAVNTATSFAANPFLGMTVTFRQILAWFAEYMGCNVRMERNGDIAFVAYDSTSVMTISPDVIVSQSRDVSRYTIAPVSQVTCYDVLGVSYSTGTDGQDYYIMNNPLFNLASNSAPVDNLLTVLSAILAYNATALTDACADPRIDAGDFITVERTDGTTYTAPVMHQALTWRGNTVTEYTATGNQVREAPSAYDVTEYESTVNKNQLDNYVLKEGDTMTGDLENTSASTRRTVMQGNRFYAENTNNTAQNAALYYNGIAATNGANTATLTPTGLDLDGTTLTSAIGTQLRSNGTTSVPNNTWTATGSFTLAKGTWVIIAYTQFPNNTTGVRGMNLHQTAGSSSGQTSEYADCGNAVGGTFVSRLRVVVTRVVGASTTFYINAYQNSGSAQTVTWVYSCVRIL